MGRSLGYQLCSTSTSRPVSDDGADLANRSVEVREVAFHRPVGGEEQEHDSPHASLGGLTSPAQRYARAAHVHSTGHSPAREVRPRCHLLVDIARVNAYYAGMTTEANKLLCDVEVSLTDVTDLLTSADPSRRLQGIRRLKVSMEILEHRVAMEANHAGMSWAAIGRVFGISRQGAHKRFSNESVFPADLFDSLMSDDDSETTVPVLTKAAARAGQIVKTRSGVAN